MQEGDRTGYVGLTWASLPATESMPILRGPLLVSQVFPRPSRATPTMLFDREPPALT